MVALSRLSLDSRRKLPCLSRPLLFTSARVEAKPDDLKQWIYAHFSVACPSTPQHNHHSLLMLYPPQLTSDETETDTT
jgi:hypothetical protein